jgi:hypothetical protein
MKGASSGDSAVERVDDAGFITRDRVAHHLMSRSISPDIRAGSGEIAGLIT